MMRKQVVVFLSSCLIFFSTSQSAFGQSLSAKEIESLKMSFQKFIRKTEHHRQRLTTIKDNKSTIALIRDASRHWEKYPSLDFTQYQEIAITELLSNFDTSCREIKTKETVNEKELSLEGQLRIEELKKKLTDSIQKSLLEHQLEALKKSDLHSVGIATIITQSVISKRLGVTDKQRQKIEKKANDLTEGIEREFSRFEKESHEIITESLTSDQIEQLNSIFGKGELARKLQPLTFEDIHQNFRLSRAVDARSSPHSEGRIKGKPTSK